MNIHICKIDEKPNGKQGKNSLSVVNLVPITTTFLEEGSPENTDIEAITIPHTKPHSKFHQVTNCFRAYLHHITL